MADDNGLIDQGALADYDIAGDDGLRQDGYPRLDPGDVTADGSLARNDRK